MGRDHESWIFCKLQWYKPPLLMCVVWFSTVHTHIFFALWLSIIYKQTAQLLILLQTKWTSTKTTTTITKQKQKQKQKYYKKLRFITSWYQRWMILCACFEHYKRQYTFKWWSKRKKEWDRVINVMNNRADKTF